MNRFIAIFLFYSVQLFAKTPLLDSIKRYDNKLVDSNFENRKLASIKLKESILVAISNGTFTDIDSLKHLSIFTSSDKKFHLFSWEIATDSNSFEYSCVIAIKKNSNYTAYSLLDKTSEMKNAELATSNINKWYAAHYYQMIENRYNNKVYYTLIGIDWKSILSKRKVIDVISIDTKGNLSISEPLFQIGKTLQRRYILEYKYDISVSCRYNSTIKMIVFDHLIPPNASLKNQKQFYINDLSFDALKFNKGKWILHEDIDARNEKSIEPKN